MSAPTYCTFIVICVHTMGIACALRNKVKTRWYTLVRVCDDELGLIEK